MESYIKKGDMVILGNRYELVVGGKTYTFYGKDAKIDIDTLGTWIDSSTIGSLTDSISPGSGISLGFEIVSSTPSVFKTLKLTEGAVEIKRRPNSRSNLS